MLGVLWPIPAWPLAGFMVLALAGRRLPRKVVAAVGVGSVGLSAVSTLVVGAGFLASRPGGNASTQTVWTWMAVEGFAPRIGFTLDALSLVMALVVTCVGFLIHVYSIEFMAGEEGYSRFFAAMNLFVASMLTLVLADDLLLLYLGWEGVGLCSYLLIGFWYDDPANGLAAQKAFIVTRVGDAAMAVGLLVLFTHLGTLNIQEVLARAARDWPVGSAPAVAAAALLLGGAVGKSAQLPLQTWLPDAMAGPTPVSALIHAATMVTAGVYLIARTGGLFALAPAVQSAVAIVGALTLLLAGASALTQRDIKRVLAYSTISQIGYMFLALGVGAGSAAIFHLMTHACFKALLFLAAGVVIHALHHEHDIFRMGGLRRELPLAFWTFLIGGASLAGFPLITAGYYSKDWILREVWESGAGGPWLWAAGWIGALLTALYVFRVVFIVFYGEPQARVGPRAGDAMRIPLIVLAALSVGVGFLEVPRSLGGAPVFSRFMHTALPAAEAPPVRGVAEITVELLALAAPLAGILLAALLFLGRRRAADAVARTRAGGALHQFWRAGWGFDWLYDTLLVRPYVGLARADRDDIFDAIYRGLAWLAQRAHGALSRTEDGRVRRYAAGVAIGAALILALAVLL